VNRRAGILAVRLGFPAQHFGGAVQRSRCRGRSPDRDNQRDFIFVDELWCGTNYVHHRGMVIQIVRLRRGPPSRIIRRPAGLRRVKATATIQRTVTTPACRGPPPTR
jgi:hypothetical protein